LRQSVTDFAANPDLDKFDAFKKRYDLLVKEKSSAAMLGVAEGFLQSAPQLVLQTTIILSREKLTGSGAIYIIIAYVFPLKMSFLCQLTLILFACFSDFSLPVRISRVLICICYEGLCDVP